MEWRRRPRFANDDSEPGGGVDETLCQLGMRLPVMVTPRWISTRTQPIALSDVIAYIVAALELISDVSLSRRERAIQRVTRCR